MGGAASRLSRVLACDSPTGSSRSVRGAWAAAAAHVVTCEGVRRARAAAAAAVSPGRAWRSVCRSCGAQFLRRLLSRGRASRRASERVPASPGRRSPLRQPPVGRSLVLPLDRFPPPRPRGAFRWACTRPLPAAPRRSSRDEFFHLFRHEPGTERRSRPRRRRERARPRSELGDGAGGRGEGGRRGAMSRQIPGWGRHPSRRRRRPRGTRGWRRAAPRSGRCHGCWAALAAAAGTRSLGERWGRGSGAGGTRGAWVRAPRGRDDLPSGRRTRESPFPLSEPMPSVWFCPGLDSPPRDLPGPGACGRGVEPGPHRCPGAEREVASRPRSPWAAGSFVPAPRCPLFLPSAGRGGREEGGSGCPDASALSDCGAGQSRAGVCSAGRPASPPADGRADRGLGLQGRPASHRALAPRNRWGGLPLSQPSAHLALAYERPGRYPAVSD